MDWFLYDNGLRHERVKKLYIALYADDNILHFNEDSGDFFMILIMVKMISKLLFMSDFCLDIKNLKNVQHLKKI